MCGDNWIAVQLRQYQFVSCVAQIFNNVLQFLVDALYLVVVAFTEEYLDGVGPAHQFVGFRVVVYVAVHLF